ncbi:Histidine kinase-, DNA gyrase B-, and HSP90-like ATPase [Limnobacter sp. 130]|uniref:ATP-binding protein n=1 Tax=Limnobacter sp. 130 TaxID=2653147 RepID=UPI0012EFEDEA|nr:ATP-binding protein [Limnobacter sp. 130]VWX37426.1 Histidine kinase-, DNA gyrase B-, and HSP90-like ATPase [Limnobacter sp. 130]
MNTNRSIIPASTAIQTFRDSGYKDTASAISELIDNSIEAGADTIRILTFEEYQKNSIRQNLKVTEMAVYDDGAGMSPQTLSICLQFGNGTRLNTRDGIGRFGIGLPNASVSQCRRVEVYSWQDSKCFMTYLDVDEIKANAQQEVNPVEECDMPLDRLNALDCSIKSHGTLILWLKCDRLDMAKASTLFNRMENQLCRVYRHFLDSDDTYGRRRDIRLVEIIKGEAEPRYRSLNANDPLYLMAPNTLPTANTEITNLAWDPINSVGVEIGGMNEFKKEYVIYLDIPYDFEGNTSLIEIRFSIAKSTTQKKGGNSALGQHYRKNTGISFMRAAREIDFGVFGYFNPQEERQRWWGCEVRFSPVLDELFGVTNNKQSVRGVDFFDLKNEADSFGGALAIDELRKDDLKFNLRYELSKIIQGNLSALMNEITSRGAGKKAVNSELSLDKSGTIANQQLQAVNKPTRASEEGKTKPQEQKLAEWTELLLGGDSSLSTNEARMLAETKVDLKIDKSFDQWPGSLFIDPRVTGSTSTLVINRKHDFFTQLYEPLTKDQEHKYSDALDLMLMAYVRAIDEMLGHEETIEILNTKWGDYVTKFLKALKTDA